MQHKCKVTVIDKKCFPDLQQQYLADPQSGPCPFYRVGDEFLFTRYGDEDTFWYTGNGTQCGEAWDCISRYIYTALQGGSIMRGWTNDGRMMIACCNDGTRPVIFRIQRLDYKVAVLEGDGLSAKAPVLSDALAALPGVERVEVRPDKGWAEIFVERDTQPADGDIRTAAEGCGFRVLRID